MKAPGQREVCAICGEYVDDCQGHAADDLLQRIAAAIFNADPRHTRRFEDGGLAPKVRQKYVLQADAAMKVVAESIVEKARAEGRVA